MFLSHTFSALSDENRRKILEILKGGEMPVSDIAVNLSITLATLSHHLDVLRRAGLVSSRRQGRQILYSLNLSVMEELAASLAKIFKSN